MSEHYVYLVRHGARNRDPAVEEAEHRLADPDQVRTIGGALADHLHATYGSGAHQIVSILTSGHVVATETANAFREVLTARGVLAATTKVRQVDELTPGPGDSEKQAAALTSVCKTLTESAGDVLVVGHQPQLTFIAYQLLDGKLPAATLPIGRAELACIRISAPRRLMWLLTSKPSDLRESLRVKIKSKFDLASLFLSALVVNLGVMLGPAAVYVFEKGYLTPKVLAGVGLLALVLALGFSMATLLALDRLLMPNEFWGGVQLKSRRFAPKRNWTVPRPPSDVTVVLFFEMVHVWNRMFAPALVLALVGIAALAVAGASTALKLPYRGTVTIALSLAVVGGLLAGLYVRHRPNLGFDD